MNGKLQDAHSLTVEKIISIAKTDIENGLDSEEARKRLDDFGPNVLDSGDKVSAFKILLHNINNIIVYLLVIASAVAFFMGDAVEGFAVIVAILIAAISGFISEYKAEKSVESLKEMVKHISKVVRNGEIREIESSRLVPGDLVFIEEGDSISADGRIVDSKNFSTVESALTGESEASEKTHDFTADMKTGLGDRKNMVFTGTAAARGNAYAVVTSTGMDTEIGKISGMIADSEKTSTPLEEQLDRLGKTLILFAGVVAAVVTALGILTGSEIYEMVKIGIVLTIAAIPEALPAVSTITLAIGMRTMASHNALVKSLPAVETLGSTTVICTDKTGTLTENQMTVRKLYTADNKTYEIDGEGYAPEGSFTFKEEKIEEFDGVLKDCITAGVMASNASISEEDGHYTVVGDPTEGGIVVMGQKAGITRKSLKKQGYSKIGEIPFDSESKYMAAAYEYPDGSKTISLKGAPDVLMEKSGMSEEDLETCRKANDNFANNGMRVLAFAKSAGYDGDGSEHSMRAHLENGISLLGLAGILDPPRSDVKESIRTAMDAGIRVIMITGDHPKTALNIAKSIGMEAGENVITGIEMDDMSDDGLAEAIMKTSVFARVSPENKLQIVRALNIDNEVTAMTGDGVNDAPALNGADIGIAMGVRGTEVAKDAADMILLDDRFATIVDAVKEGRVIFDNIEKFVYFLFSCNVVEILTVFLTIILAMPMPVLPLQILWLNLVVDILPAMSIAREAGEKDIMKRQPRDPQKAIVTKSFLVRVLSNGALIGLGSLAALAVGLAAGFDTDTARTMSFSTMALGQLIHIFNVRKTKGFGLDKSLFKNPYLPGALSISVIFQLMVIYLPFFNRIMETVPLDVVQWLWVLLFSSVPTLLIQLKRKLFSSRA